MFPVGLVLKYGVSSPILRDGKVTGFYDAFQAGRKVRQFLIIVLLFKAEVKHNIVYNSLLLVCNGYGRILRFRQALEVSA